MEFWGVEVKPGEQFKVKPESGKLIHISQAALGEVKDAKGAKHVPLRLKIDAKNFILGTLSTEDKTQLMFDLVFEREFELSHDWKNGSVHFIGYSADDPISDEEGFLDEFEAPKIAAPAAPEAICKKQELPASESESESDSDDEPIDVIENGDVKAIVKTARNTDAAKAISKNQGLFSEQYGSDSDDEMALDQKDDSSDVSLDDSENDSDEEFFSSEDELPKVSQLNKKRSAESAQATPAAKIAKPSASVKTDNIKNRKATPSSSKKAEKGSMNMSKGKNQKSGGPKGRK